MSRDEPNREQFTLVIAMRVFENLEIPITYAGMAVALRWPMQDVARVMGELIARGWANRTQEMMN